MPTLSADLRQRLRQHGQEHVLASWDRLNESERTELLDQLRAIDLDELRELYALRDERFSLPNPERITPIARVAENKGAAEKVRPLAEEAFRRGQVAALIVAGGQGSRLGFDHPKGLFPIGPVSRKSLFQMHAEKVLALGRRHGNPVPFLIMTSPATHAETVDFFTEKRFFGLAREDVFFFCQGTMPALDLATGKLVMAKPGRLFTSPNGHGGTLTALADSGLLGQLKSRGIRTIFYFQVDNPLVNVADLAFLGKHLAANAQVSAKAIPKEAPFEKLGLFVLVDGRLTIIEYSDLPEELARKTDAQGQLLFWAGSPAIHIFQVDFLETITGGPQRLPWHLARKKVPFIDEQGKEVEPEHDNALKFEMFVFDVFPMADRWALVPTSRKNEFMPLKNASGPESPDTVRQAQSNLAADWLESAGVRVPRQANGDAAVPLEISPLFALDPQELAGKIDPGMTIDGPRYFGE